MKQKIVSKTQVAIAKLIICLSISTICFGQAPNSFKYQSVLRDENGTVLKESDVNIEIQILQGSSTGTVVFSETHSTTTNEFGLINLNIGSKNPEEISLINWSSGPYFIKVIINDIEMGTSELLSVPYAKYAAYSGGIDNVKISEGSVFIGREVGENSELSNKNTFVGDSSGVVNTTGRNNVALGNKALMNNSLGNSNSAIGTSVMYQNYSGNYNVGIGHNSMYKNHHGSSNIAIGTGALYSNTGISDLIAIGDSALYNNTTHFNLAIGTKALQNNTIGQNNTAIGHLALNKNIAGTGNLAFGHEALSSNSSGSNNLAIGNKALWNNTTGSSNFAIGMQSLNLNTTGTTNTSVGRNSMYENTSGCYNTSLGFNAMYSNETGNHNVAIGYYAGPTGTNPDLSNTIAIGSNTKVSSSNTVRIGNSSITSIGGYAPWTTLSDGRFKTNVKTNVPGIEFIMKLRPVTYNWDLHKLDEVTGTPDSLYLQNPSLDEARSKKETLTQTGFIAQEVEEAAKACNYEFSGVIKPENKKSQYTLSYAEFVVPLVKAVQEQQEIINQQQETIQKLINDLNLLKQKLDNQ